MKFITVCITFIIITLLSSCSLAAKEELGLNPIDQIPAGFPEFRVPGAEKEMAAMRQLFYHHYLYVDGATMWDAWIPGSLLWADTGSNPQHETLKNKIRNTLASRYIDPQGYVSTHQVLGLAHPYGWPFPLWLQSQGIGWQFAVTDLIQPEALGIKRTLTLDGWKLEGVKVINNEPEKGLHIKMIKNRASLTTPDFEVKAIVSPFVGLYLWLDELNQKTVYSMQWKTKEHPDFSNKRQVYFTPDKKIKKRYPVAVPLHELVEKDEIITGFRINIDNALSEKIVIQAIFTATDSRHPVNNPSFVIGCLDYVDWTGDLNFLRDQIQRMRLALLYAIDEFQVEKFGCVYVPWWGHDGASGLEITPEAEKTIHYGRGIGNNYFDLVPFGGKDAYATIYLYESLLRMAELEKALLQNPQWNIPAGPLRQDHEELKALCSQIKSEFQKLFWNEKTGRFVACIDKQGHSYDYGFVFLNLEAVNMGLASQTQAKSIMEWLTGIRIVENDTSKGKDIYHWRFAPRLTTKRNIEYYSWVWYIPETIPWGDQIQDGGAALAWSYYDLMSRMKTYGPENAWNRLEEILKWFQEVQSEGGYRKYYSKPGRGNLQGGFVAGGLGLDKEFVESILLPQVMIRGFLGLHPRSDCLSFNPDLPKSWPKLTVTGIRWHGNLIDVTVNKDKIMISVREKMADIINICPPKGRWTYSLESDNHKSSVRDFSSDGENSLSLPINTGTVIEMKRQ